jgi:hypothetical protein
MKESIESIREQFEALNAKVDPTSAEMLKDHDYAVQLADCVAKTYLTLNDTMCEELSVCHSCAQQRDFLRDALERFEAIAQNGNVDASDETFYFGFIERLSEIRENIRVALASL